MFSNPFNFPDEELDLIDLNLQMEAVDLKTNSFSKSNFLDNRSSASDEISFWKLLPDSKFPNKKKLQKNVLAALEQALEQHVSVSKISPHLM